MSGGAGSLTPVIRAVLFDFYGTLGEYDRSAPRLPDALAELGYTVSPDTIWALLNDGLDGSEHDEQGDTTHQPQVHVDQTERRFSKLALLEDGTYDSENTSASVAILPWGGSKGAARAAYNRLRADGTDLEIGRAHV